MSTQLHDYSYTFPPELIALAPADQRDASRLMHVNRKSKSVAHQTFKNILDHFVAGDVLVLNNSKVFACRLLTQRKSGGKQEIFLIRRIDSDSQCLPAMPQEEIWEVLLGPNSKIKANDVFQFQNLKVTALNGVNDLPRLVKLQFEGNLFDILNNIAHIPLPSYIKREDTAADHERYQTVFAKNQGSVAAPTAGLHFTDELLRALQNKGVEIHFVTLHVGLGTFLPVKTANILDHKMHEELFSIEPVVWQRITQAQAENRRVTAVGTTSVRVLETLAQNAAIGSSGEMQRTQIFIHPPYQFKIVDRMITNFHQPESTLLMLVSAFADREFILSAYHEAIKERYRLFSYGDAMLIE